MWAISAGNDHIFLCRIPHRNDREKFRHSKRIKHSFIVFSFLVGNKKEIRFFFLFFRRVRNRNKESQLT